MSPQVVRIPGMCLKLTERAQDAVDRILSGSTAGATEGSLTSKAIEKALKGKKVETNTYAGVKYFSLQKPKKKEASAEV